MSLFSNLQYNVAVGVSQLGFNSAFSLSRYKQYSVNSYVID